MRTTLVAVLIALTAAAPVAAQMNTTGSLSPNTTVTQSTTTPGTTTGGTTTSTTTTPGTPTPAATTPLRDAAIIICGEDFSTGTPRLLVFTASTSAGSATIAPALPCAQALSDLFVAGFQIIDVLPFNQQLQYTLVR